MTFIRIKDIKKALLILLCLLFAASFLTGCSSIDGKLYSKSQVIKRVKDKIPEEKFVFESVEHYSDERPKRDVYTFKSKERDFSFTAISTLENIWIDGATGLYSKYIKLNYTDEVHELYIPEMEEFLSGISAGEDKFNNRYFYYGSYAELESVAKAIAKADDVYKKELAYNSPEWLHKNPAMTISVRFTGEDDNGEEAITPVFGFAFDGSWDLDRITEYVEYYHAQAIYDGKISDESTPVDVLKKAHKSELEVYLNDICVAEDAAVRDKAAGLYNRSDNYNYKYNSFYYQPWETYIIAINLGLTTHEYAPQIIEYYSEALWLDAEIGSNNGEVTIENDNNKWSIRAKDEKNDIYFLEISKNGVVQDIPYVISDDFTKIGSSYIVGIPVENFADIMGLTYTIDEDEGTLRFAQK